MTNPLALGLVDVEQLISTFLRQQTEVTDLVSTRIFTDLPHQRVYPLVLITRIGGGFLINHPQWLDEASIQLDVLGGTHKQAEAINATILAVMSQRMIGLHDSIGCCTGVSIESILYNPDIEFTDGVGHARPRYTTTVNVLAHP